MRLSYSLCARFNKLCLLDLRIESLSYEGTTLLREDALNMPRSFASWVIVAGMFLLSLNYYILFFMYVCKPS